MLVVTVLVFAFAFAFAMYRMFLSDRHVLPAIAMGVTAMAAVSSLEPLYKHYLPDLSPSSSDPSLASNFHFARRFAGEPLDEALARHEHYLFAHLTPRRGMRILELGCGTGARARQLAHFSDAAVVGVDADASNIRIAQACAASSGLAHRVQFLQVSPDALHAFDAGSFDAVFSVEAITGSPDFAAVCAQVRRLLKPGGRFAFYRWCAAAAYDPALLGHRQVRAQLAGALAAPLAIPTVRETKDALCNGAEFALLHCEDVAAHADAVPWYRVLEEKTTALAWAWWRQDDAVDPELARRAILKAGKLELLTPMALFVVQKDVT